MPDLDAQYRYRRHRGRFDRRCGDGGPDQHQWKRLGFAQRIEQPGRWQSQYRNVDGDQWIDVDQRYQWLGRWFDQPVGDRQHIASDRQRVNAGDHNIRKRLDIDLWNRHHFHFGERDWNWKYLGVWRPERDRLHVDQHLANLGGCVDYLDELDPRRSSVEWPLLESERLEQRRFGRPDGWPVRHGR